MISNFISELDKTCWHHNWEDLTPAQAAPQIQLSWVVPGSSCQQKQMKYIFITANIFHNYHALL